jgi:plastocyanin
VLIKNFAYQVPASVPAGAKITVRNEDATTHTIRDKGHAFDVNPANSSATFAAPSKPGHYLLYCKYHGNMSGMLVVS